MTEEGASVYAAVLELRSKCEALQTPEERDAKVAAWEAEKARLDEEHRHRMRVEATRNKVAQQQEYAEKAQQRQEENIAAGLVEVRIDPGRTWTMDWFRREVAYRIQDLRPELMDKDLGTLAVLRGVDMLEERRRQGRTVTNPAGFVVNEARKVMAKRGGPTTWVPQEVANKTPHLIVRRYSESFAGKMSERWAKRQQRLEEDDQRRAMGLLPLWQV